MLFLNMVCLTVGLAHHLHLEIFSVNFGIQHKFDLFYVMSLL
jgi:hypothetical protein